MKILLASVLITLTLVMLIISIDMIMGTKFSGIVTKELNPFRVMEPAENIIILLFILYFFIKSVVNFFKKRNENTKSSP